MEKRIFQVLLGSEIRRHRKALKMSQEQLAERAEVHPTFISNIERGKVSVSAYCLCKIADALKVRVGDLLLKEVAAEDMAFEQEMADIAISLREMSHEQRKIYLAAINGMLSHK